MLLGSSGKNIYPEEIESLFNNKFGVSEAIIVQRNDKLVALIHPDKDFMQQQGYNNESIKELFEEYKKDINDELPNYMNVSQVIIQSDEFAKTPKRSIKRFLYN